MSKWSKKLPSQPTGKRNQPLFHPGWSEILAIVRTGGRCIRMFLIGSLITAIQIIPILMWVAYAFPVLHFDCLFSYIIPKLVTATKVFSGSVKQFPVDPAGLSSLAAAGGLAGTLMSWLLQHIRDEECGNELGTIFKKRYPFYPIRLLLFIFSTAICLFFTATHFESYIRVYYIVLCNLAAMAVALVYIGGMCWTFLLNQNRRKRQVHRYLQRLIRSGWRQSHYRAWNTTGTDQLITDFPNCAHWKTRNPAIWFFQRWLERIERIEETAPGSENIPARCLWESESLLVLIWEQCGGQQMDKIFGCAIATFLKNRTLTRTPSSRVRTAYWSFIVIWSAAMYNNMNRQLDEYDRVLSVFQNVTSAVVHAMNLIKHKKRKLAPRAGEAIHCCAAALTIIRANANREIDDGLVHQLFITYKRAYNSQYLKSELLPEDEIKIETTAKYVLQTIGDPLHVARLTQPNKAPQPPNGSASSHVKKERPSSDPDKDSSGFGDPTRAEPADSSKEERH